LTLLPGKHLSAGATSPICHHCHCHLRSWTIIIPLILVDLDTLDPNYAVSDLIEDSPCSLLSIFNSELNQLLFADLLSSWIDFE
jgi:hypothetical protein